jgi:hypothetical protein
MRTRLIAKTHRRLLIALAIAIAGIVSISLSWLGTWTGVREPVQHSYQRATPSAQTDN